MGLVIRNRQVQRTAGAFALALGVTLLQGCVSDKQVAEQREQRCRAMGAITQDQMFQCRMMLHQQHVAASNHNGAVMQAVGRQLMNPPQYNQPMVLTQPPRPVNCHTTYDAAGARTSCF